MKSRTPTIFSPLPLTLIIDIFEPRSGNTPTIRHQFFGKSRSDIMEIVNAHKGTDSFFRGALDKGSWNRIPLRVTFSWQ